MQPRNPGHKYAASKANHGHRPRTQTHAVLTLPCCSGGGGTTGPALVASATLFWCCGGGGGGNGPVPVASTTILLCCGGGGGIKGPVLVASTTTFWCGSGGGMKGPAPVASTAMFVCWGGGGGMKGPAPVASTTMATAKLPSLGCITVTYCRAGSCTARPAACWKAPISDPTSYLQHKHTQPGCQADPSAIQHTLASHIARSKLGLRKRHAYAWIWCP